MKNSLIEVNKRRAEVIELLKKMPNISTENLAVNLNVSPLTVRRDLQFLEKNGIVKRYYGGAQLLIAEKNESPPPPCPMELIAKTAADEIADGDIIFINSSATALSILKYVGNKNVIVVTNNGKILDADFPPNVEVLVTGGQIMYNKHSMVGDFALRSLQNVSASKCFLGVSGIDFASGISTSIMQETLINKEMIDRTSGAVYVVAESKKILKPNNFSSGTIDKIDYFVTDKNIKAEYIEEFRLAGVEVLFADDGN